MILRNTYYNAYCDCPCTNRAAGMMCIRSLGEDGADAPSMETRSDAARTALALGWKRKGKKHFASQFFTRAKPKCPKCKKASLLFFAKLNRVECRHLLTCGWRKTVSRAAIIRLAVDPQAEYSRGYAAGHEDVMKCRIRDAMEAKRNG